MAVEERAAGEPMIGAAHLVGVFGVILEPILNARIPRAPTLAGSPALD